MKTKMLQREINLQNPPPLSDEQRARLSVLARMPDSSIDYSDIPPLGDDFWKSAVRNPFYKPTKQVTRLEPEQSQAQALE